MAENNPLVLFRTNLFKICLKMTELTSKVFSELKSLDKEKRDIFAKDLFAQLRDKLSREIVTNLGETGTNTSTPEKYKYDLGEILLKIQRQILIFKAEEEKFKNIAESAKRIWKKNPSLAMSFNHIDTFVEFYESFFKGFHFLLLNRMLKKAGFQKKTEYMNTLESQEEAIKSMRILIGVFNDQRVGSERRQIMGKLKNLISKLDDEMAKEHEMIEETDKDLTKIRSKFGKIFSGLFEKKLWDTARIKL